MKIKVAEATPLQLDWMVANLEGLTQFGPPPGRSQASEFVLMHDDDSALQYSTDWGAGGPIIDREDISIAVGAYDVDATPVVQGYAACTLYNEIHDGPWIVGPTKLVAAMRCFVASRLGDEVELPQELA